MQALVLDTNVVLDLLVFADPRTAKLRSALDAGEAQWLATAQMRDELAHVLLYPNFVEREPGAEAVLRAFDERARLVETPERTRVLCRDADDQKFIDLAVAQRAFLVSKDKEVLRLRKKLAPYNVAVAAVYS